MNFLQRKKLAFMSIVNQIKGFVRTVLGVLPLTLPDCVDDKSVIDYKIYGESVQNGEPTPENPIEVESVGEKTKNLFDFDTAISSTDSWYYSGGSRSYGLELEMGKQYTLSCEIVNHTEGVTVNIVRKPDISKWGNTKLFQLSGTLGRKSYTFISDGTECLWVYKDGGATMDLVSKYLIENIEYVQLEEGDTATEYEPYGKYKIPVTAKGKNLIPGWKSGWVAVNTGVLNETTYPNRRYTDYIPIENGAAYVISGGGNNSNYTLYDENYNFFTGQILSSSRGFSVTGTSEAAKYVRIAHPNTNVSNIQLEKGAVATEYEPYVEPITTNIYLDEPLRKVGDYADYINFEKSLVFRKIYKEYFTKVTSTSSESTTYKKFITPISKKPLIKSTILNSTNVGDMRGYAISNKFVQSEVNYNNLGKYPNLIQTYIPTGGGYRVANTFDDSSITTVAQANEKIGDGFDVCYVLEEQIEESIELPNLPTFKGTTIYTIDTSIQPSNMEVTYYSTSKE